MTPRFRASWPAAGLVAAYPPRFTHPNKQLVYAISEGRPHDGTVTVSRWAPMALPSGAMRCPTLDAVPGYFTYASSAPGWIDWHQNFADPHLFGYYAGALFAQDEMMVTEHPALASVRGAMSAAGEPAFTVEGGPTPVLVAGVERRCVVDTEPDLAPGRIEGLYGNRFGRASEAAIRSATRRLDPPTISNIVAIAAISGGRGRYTRQEIVETLTTAYTGYAAAVAESHELAPGAKVAMHTGFWGCGAFGGDRVLMVTLQALAAGLAGVGRVVLHHGDSTGKDPIAEARRVLRDLDGAALDAGIDTLAASGFAWGVSDGN